MDIATIVGIGGGFTLMIVALLLAGSHGSGDGLSFGQFIDPPAAIMVLGGGLCVVMTSVPLAKFLTLPKMVLKLVRNQSEDLGALVRQIVTLSELARRDGLLALERHVPELTNHSLAIGVQMAVDGTRTEIIQQIMRTEMKAEEARHHVGKRMFDMMGRCGPAFGMIATLLGLILMLGNLDDPDSIGPSMAMALVGTLYGAAMANMICMPCAEKLAYLSHQEQLSKEIVLQGVMAIQAGDSPRIVEQKLIAYLPTGLADAIKEAA
jgi:chemotaxis protein MotA